MMSLVDDQKAETWSSWPFALIKCAQKHKKFAKVGSKLCQNQNKR